MSLKESIIAELKHEAESTRKLLERVPSDKFDWKPHEKSMSLKSLATHIANLSRFAGIIASTPYLDFAEGGLIKPEINNTSDLIHELQTGIQTSIEALQSVTDEDLKQNWALKNKGHVIFELPKAVAIRNVGMNHIYHHRGQLSVYLRLLDVKIPGMYGPSNDEMAQVGF